MPLLSFETKGSRSSSAGCLLTAFLLIGVITVFCISFALPKYVGPWWLWLLALVPVSAFGYWVSKRDEVTVVFMNHGKGKFSVHINGPRTKMVFDAVQEYEYWYAIEYQKLKFGIRGGPIFLKRFVRLTNGDGKQIVFKEMGGKPNNPPAEWPHRQSDPGEGPGIMHLEKTEALIKFLQSGNPSQN